MNSHKQPVNQLNEYKRIFKDTFKESMFKNTSSEELRKLILHNLEDCLNQPRNKNNITLIQAIVELNLLAAKHQLDAKNLDLFDFYLQGAIFFTLKFPDKFKEEESLILYYTGLSILAKKEPTLIFAFLDNISAEKYRETKYKLELKFFELYNNKRKAFPDFIEKMLNEDQLLFNDIIKQLAAMLPRKSKFIHKIFFNLLKNHIHQIKRNEVLTMLTCLASSTVPEHIELRKTLLTIYDTQSIFKEIEKKSSSGIAYQIGESPQELENYFQLLNYTPFNMKNLQKDYQTNDVFILYQLALHLAIRSRLPESIFGEFGSDPTFAQTTSALNSYLQNGLVKILGVNEATALMILNVKKEEMIELYENKILADLKKLPKKVIPLKAAKEEEFENFLLPPIDLVIQRYHSGRRKLNLFPPKISRTEMLINEAKAFGFECIDVNRLGNCLYEAIAHQIEQHKISSLMHHTHQSLRQLAVDHIEKYTAFYWEFFIDDDSTMQTLRKEGVFANDLTISALSRELNFNLVIIDNTGSVIVKKHHNPIATFYIGHEKENHYLSLVKNNQKPQKNIEFYIAEAAFDKFEEAISALYAENKPETNGMSLSP